MPTPEETYQDIESRMQSLEGRYRQSFAEASTVEALETAHGSIFTEESDLTQAIRMMRELPFEWGSQLNTLVGSFRAGLEAAYQERLSQVQ